MEREPSETNFTTRARRLHRLRRVWVFVFALWLGTSTTRAAALKASLDRESVVVGETFTLTLSVEDAQLPGNPNLPAIPGIQVLESSSSFSTSFINGQSSSVQTFVFTLTANRTGEINIPAFQLDANGNKLSSSPLKMIVRKADATKASANPAFIRIVLPKKDFFVGEAFVAELRLFLRNDVGDISNLQLPPISGEGFNAGKLVQGKQFSSNLPEGTFIVLPFYFTVTVVKSGPLAIPAMAGSVTVLGGPRNIWGQFTQSARAVLSTEPEPVNARDLPAENIPPGFSGAVGSYTMTATVGPTNVAAGDPITVRIQITGQGALDAINIRTEDSWHDFKTYPPTSNIEVTDQFGLQGRKNFEQIVSPENADIKELPAFSFSYFDAGAKSYRTLTHPATKLIIRPGGATVAPVITATKNTRDESPQPQLDIVPIKQRPGVLVKSTTPLVTQTWFIAMNAVPILAFLGAFAWRRASDSLANNPRLRRRRQVEHTIRNGLVELRKLADANKSEEFFALLFRLLQEQLGERLDCPATAITEAVVDEKLQSAAPEATRATLHDLFQACNLARYAPVRSATELASHLAKLETTVEELRRMRP